MKIKSNISPMGRKREVVEGLKKFFKYFWKEVLISLGGTGLIVLGFFFGKTLLLPLAAILAILLIFVLVIFLVFMTENDSELSEEKKKIAKSILTILTIVAVIFALLGLGFIFN